MNQESKTTKEWQKHCIYSRWWLSGPISAESLCLDEIYSPVFFARCFSSSFIYDPVISKFLYCFFFFASFLYCFSYCGCAHFHHEMYFHWHSRRFWRCTGCCFGMPVISSWSVHSMTSSPANSDATSLTCYHCWLFHRRFLNLKRNYDLILMMNFQFILAFQQLKFQDDFDSHADWSTSEDQNWWSIRCHFRYSPFSPLLILFQWQRLTALTAPHFASSCCSPLLTGAWSLSFSTSMCLIFAFFNDFKIKVHNKISIKMYKCIDFYI